MPLNFEVGKFFVKTISKRTSCVHDNFTREIERVKFLNFHTVFKSRFFFHELYSWWWSGGGKKKGAQLSMEPKKRKQKPHNTDDARPGGLSKRPRLKKRRLFGCGKVYLWFAFSEPRVFLHGRRDRGDFLDGSFLLCSSLVSLLRGSLSASSGGFTTKSLAPWTY